MCDKYCIKIIHLIATILWNQVWLPFYKWDIESLSLHLYKVRQQVRVWTYFIILKNALVRYAVHLLGPCIQLFFSLAYPSVSYELCFCNSINGHMQINLELGSIIYNPWGWESQNSILRQLHQTDSLVGVCLHHRMAAISFKGCSLPYTIVGAQ